MSRTRPDQRRRPARKVRRQQNRRERHKSNHELMWEVLMEDYERCLTLQYGEGL